MGLYEILFIFGCFTVINAELPSWCAAVSCAVPDCLNPVTPPEQCCPICPGEKPGQCPRLRPGTVGICVELCSNDFDCSGSQKCCSNGCGHVCTTPRGRGGMDCSLVRCPAVYCVGQYTLPGQCCPVCPPNRY